MRVNDNIYIYIYTFTLYIQVYTLYMYIYTHMYYYICQAAVLRGDAGEAGGAPLLRVFEEPLVRVPAAVERKHR